MSQQKKKKPLDELLSNAVGRQELDFDFDKWQKQHSNEVRQFQAKTNHVPARSHYTWRIIVKSKITKRLTAAAAIIIAAIIGIIQFDGNHNIAFAQVLERIEKAKTISWTTTLYIRVTSKDGKRNWVETETRQCAYKSPGLYRVVYDETRFGQVRHEVITDTINMKELNLTAEDKTAIISEIASSTYNSQGPFFWQTEYIKNHNLEWVGKRENESGEVNIFRSSFRDKANNEDWSYDFWIDFETKELVAIQIPGADIYDSEKEPVCENIAEKDWSTTKSLCTIMYNINYDIELDEKLFRFEVPHDYTIQNKHRAQVTEQEMIEYFGILADFNNKTFPDQLSPVPITLDRIKKARAKPREERTEAEQKLLDTHDYYRMAGLNKMPIGHFCDDHTVKNSFRYLGKGVKLGDKDRIVCWYRLKGSSTYRVVYGDLSVSDVDPQDLPLSTEPPTDIKD